MRKVQLYAGVVSLGIAGTLFSLDLRMIRISFSDTPQSTLTIYPAAFFAFLGFLLVYLGLKPLWRK